MWLWEYNSRWLVRHTSSISRHSSRPTCRFPVIPTCSCHDSHLCSLPFRIQEIFLRGRSLIGQAFKLRQRVLHRHKCDPLIDWCAKVRNLSVSVWSSAHCVDNTFRSHPLNLIFLLVLKGPDQVDALLNWAHWSNFVINFHGTVISCLARVHAGHVANWPVEELTFWLVNKLIRTALHHYKVALPTICQAKVLFSWWEGTWLTFFKRHSCLSHDFFDVLMGFQGQAFKFLYFWVLPWANVSYSWQLVRRVGILDSEACWHFLRFLVKVLSEELMKLIVIARCRNLEAVIPFRPGSLSLDSP